MFLSSALRCLVTILTAIQDVSSGNQSLFEMFWYFKTPRYIVTAKKVTKKGRIICENRYQVRSTVYYIHVVV